LQKQLHFDYSELFKTFIDLFCIDMLFGLVLESIIMETFM